MNNYKKDPARQAADRPKTLRIILSVLIAFFIWMAALLAAPEISFATKTTARMANRPTKTAGSIFPNFIFILLYSALMLLFISPGPAGTAHQ